MKIKQTVTWDFPNYGIPHEQNLNLIGMALTIKKIKHQIPVSIIYDVENYFQNLPEVVGKKYGRSFVELVEYADRLGLAFPLVTASVQVMGTVYKVIFSCYGE